MAKVTQPNDDIFALAENAEGCKLKAYLCPAKKWTIGIGTTVYPNGTKVQPFDTCTRAQAIQYYKHDLKGAAKDVDDLTVDTINSNQFTALCDFVYNTGRGAYQSSTLRRLVNNNPNDPKIADAFRQWVFGGDGSHNGVDDDRDGVIDEPGEKQRLRGLEIRREALIKLYFKK